MEVRGYLGRFGDHIGILEGEPASLTVRPGPAAPNPSYLTLAADGRTLYAAEHGDEPVDGQVSAYDVTDDDLRPLGSQPVGGRGPCHVSVDPSGRHLLSANYGSGSVAVHPIASDGSLGARMDLVQHVGDGPHQDRQAGPHAHMVVPTPDGEHVLAVDLGTDTVYRYQLMDGTLVAAGAAAAPAGAGPRHLAFHPSGRYAYVANELDSTVSVLDLQTYAVGDTVTTLPDDEHADSHPSAIRVSDDGRHCYVANRGPDTIAVLAISPDGASLGLTATVPCGGEHPRDMVLAGDWLYVANQHSNVVTPFRISPQSGEPQPAGNPLSTPGPACILFTQ